MAKGVFNPFEVPKKKKKFRSSTDLKNPYDSEFSTPTLGDIKLDGDSYVLELKEIDLKDIAPRLGALLKDVTAAHRDVMLRHGVELLPIEDPRAIEEGEVSLPTPDGHICVYVSQENTEQKVQTEVEVFRRIACALLEVPRELLVKHKARVIVRA